MSEHDSPPAPPDGTPPGPAPAASEWPLKAVDLVDAVVGGVSDRVVRPLVLAARAIVFGMLVATMALIVVVLGSVMLVRICDVYFFSGRVWASDALVGVLLCAAGLAAWSRRTAGRRTAGSHH